MYIYKSWNNEIRSTPRSLILKKNNQQMHQQYHIQYVHHILLFTVTYFFVNFIKIIKISSKIKTTVPPYSNPTIIYKILLFGWIHTKLSPLAVFWLNFNKIHLPLQELTHHRGVYSIWKFTWILLNYNWFQNVIGIYVTVNKHNQ